MSISSDVLLAHVAAVCVGSAGHIKTTDLF